MRKIDYVMEIDSIGDLFIMPQITLSLLYFPAPASLRPGTSVTSVLVSYHSDTVKDTPIDRMAPDCPGHSFQFDP